jgi:uncharacterized protein
VQCPTDRTTLQPMDRQGVEIDFCPQCRGVWLDRGELDKLIDRAASNIAGPGQRAGLQQEYDRPAPRPEYGRGHDSRYRDDDYDDDDAYRYRGRKRRGWLGEIFDFD